MARTVALLPCFRARRRRQHFPVLVDLAFQLDSVRKSGVLRSLLTLRILLVDLLQIDMLMLELLLVPFVDHSVVINALASCIREVAAVKLVVIGGRCVLLVFLGLPRRGVGMLEAFLASGSHLLPLFLAMTGIAAIVRGSSLHEVVSKFYINNII